MEFIKKCIVRWKINKLLDEEGRKLIIDAAEVANKKLENEKNIGLADLKNKDGELAIEISADDIVNADKELAYAWAEDIVSYSLNGEHTQGYSWMTRVNLVNKLADKIISDIVK